MVTSTIEDYVLKVGMAVYLRFVQVIEDKYIPGRNIVNMEVPPLEVSTLQKHTG